MSAICTRSTHNCTAFDVNRLANTLRKVKPHAGYWIAGDSAYESRDDMVTRRSPSASQGEETRTSCDAFNFYHSSARVHVEQSFGLLVARFGILRHPLCMGLSKVPIIISTCTRIYNYCIECGFSHSPRVISTRDASKIGQAFQTGGDYRKIFVLNVVIRVNAQ